MADSFFGFDTSLSNLNDDEGGGGPSEDEYDALNDETFGDESGTFDWEVEHEQLAEKLESSRRLSNIADRPEARLEASLSQLVLDETDGPHSTLGSSVWRHDGFAFPSASAAPAPAPPMAKACTVEELERQLRQKHQQTPAQAFNNQQNFFQPRFPPIILQRPPGIQGPVPLPFAPQQPMNNLNQMNQPLNKIIGANNQMSQNNQIMQNQMSQNNQLMQNQMGQNMSQMGQNLNQMNQNMNQMGPNVNQIGQNMNQVGQKINQPGQNQFFQNNQMSNFQNQLGQNLMNQITQKIDPIKNQIGQNMNQMSQNLNLAGQNVNQMGQNLSQMGQNVNQMGQGVNQMGQNQMSNGNQFQNMNQFPHMMGQPRMMAPPPGLSIPRPNFGPNMGQFNNFRGPTIQTKPNEQPNMSQNIMNPQLMQQQMQNQSPLFNSNVNQSPSSKNQSNQKVQKSRVYNNSKQMTPQNLTSQNLVQMIQNTHPMLQFNNTYHNANHHPMLNRNNMNIFNNSQAMNTFNHRQNEGLNNNNNNRGIMNGDDCSGSSETDEYAGLMSQREKQWLINIQMLQLNTGTPYIHDFYYTVFLERQSRKEKEGVKEAHKANQQNHPFYSGAVKQETHRERHNSRHNSCGEDAPTPRVYVPAQFENSLGKLQCGSVTAPRKIIDVEVVAGEPASGRISRAPSVASTANPAEVPREFKRTKQLLLEIEALYLILLRLEELNDPLAISNALILKEREEKQKLLEAAQKEAEEQEEDTNLFLRNIESVQRRPKQESPKSDTIDKRTVVNLTPNQKPPPAKNLLDEDRDDLLNKMFAGLLHSDRLTQMLAVRKGRSLVTRFVSRCPVTSGAQLARLRIMWRRVIRALPVVSRRDDGSLTDLAPHYRNYIQHTTGWTAILESCGLLSESFDPARTPYALTSALTLSCVCALFEKAITLVNTPDATSNERQWSKFLKTLARALKNTTLTVAKPVTPLPEAKLLFHMKLLDSRNTIEILQRGKPASEFADLTKSEVTEQLVKHLC